MGEWEKGWGAVSPDTQQGEKSDALWEFLCVSFGMCVSEVGLSSLGQEATCQDPDRSGEVLNGARSENASLAVAPNVRWLTLAVFS